MTFDEYKRQVAIIWSTPESALTAERVKSMVDRAERRITKAIQAMAKRP